MDKEVIQLKLINNNIDISSLTSMQFITLLMEEAEKLNDLSGNDKKFIVIKTINDFLSNNDNIFITSNNNNIITSLNTIINNDIISDIIDTIVLCTTNVVKINNKIKSKCFCLSK